MTFYSDCVRLLLATLVVFAMKMALCPICAEEAAISIEIRPNFDTALRADNTQALMKALADMKRGIEHQPENVVLRREIIDMLSRVMSSLKTKDVFRQWRGVVESVTNVETIIGLPGADAQVLALHGVGLGSSVLIQAAGNAYLDNSPVAESASERFDLLMHYIAVFVRIRRLALNTPADTSLWEQDPSLVNRLAAAGYTIGGALDPSSIREPELSDRLRRAMESNKILQERRRIAIKAAEVSDAMWQLLRKTQAVRLLVDKYHFDETHVEKELSKLHLTDEEVRLLLQDK